MKTMDIKELIDCLGHLGAPLHKSTTLHRPFLNTLEETSAKIQRLQQTLSSLTDSTSSAEIQCYERYVSSISNNIIKENTTLVMNLLKILQQKIKSYAKTAYNSTPESHNEKLVKVIQICKRIENDMSIKKTYLSMDEEFWRILYRIIKYEQILRARYLVYNNNI
ncbi:hypothetical protein SteCoe_18480 [Stentor coeruleus]|uniref:Uncharacterized protein n=1 Tax=Stentor coeruleus TaxID=5963 RepID=A0A1R2BWE9_9CILI|nr:hypothetical protein SteCoe_18480 [Stentor coeruleus]